MPINIIIPDMGESVRTGVVAKWHKKDGDVVKRDEVVMDLETDKITAEITAPANGVLKRSVKEGDTVPIGSSVGVVDEAGAPATTAAASPAAPAAKPAPAPAAAASAPTSNGHHGSDDVRATPLARKAAGELGVNLAAVAPTGPGGRVREQDVLNVAQARATPAAPVAAAPRQAPAAGSRREKFTSLRTRLAERLVSAQHNAAMLTTFNEVDMSGIMALRGKYKEEFEKKYGIGLGFMSFFVRAATIALQKLPVVNSYIVQGAEGGLEIEYHDHCHISVAVSTPKGLTVPVVRNTQNMSFADIELAIKDLATRARDGKLTLDDLQGGTFTVTNGGIFGSLMSTPILNPPQTAILGMHAIKNRPVENPDKPGEIVLRPMMYLAMSYDHRLLDGQEAVTFLVTIKNCIERPERMLLGI
jgi:2-oxoglutarate dehydrogenase E2 component (dihydrolipoamide succinyltransferase)